MKNLITKYEVVSNIECFSRTTFKTKSEAVKHIIEDLEWIKDKPQYKHLTHKIKEVQVEVNPKEELHMYFSDY
tara:strand:- start:929 stop:1147 length:219 start_codon:yes stop_codon:yes gene_type:complete